jgi:outer membrane receptor protein involved in Fe transport
MKAFGSESIWKELTVFGNFNEGFRAPSPIELTCADPNAPCSLPNSFVADPPLKPVVSQTFETGVRGKLTEATKWDFTLFHSRLTNDILFVTSAGTNQTGYFQNVGTTLRQGGQLSLNGQWEKLYWSISYSFVDATYQTPITLNSALGPMDVKPGNRVPGIPQQTLKLGVEYEVLQGWFFGGDLQFASSQYARGDDNNTHAPVAEYVVLNMNTRYAVNRYVELFAMARNITDTRYETFGVMNTNYFRGGEGERFVGPGAPIAGWAGVRFRFD